jgi:hypothetical protein
MKEPRLGPAAAGFGVFVVVLKPDASVADPAPAIRALLGYLDAHADGCDRLCNDDEHVFEGSETV